MRSGDSYGRWERGLKTFSDWCAEVRELAGERWPDFSEQAPTLAGWRGGATPAQAFYIVGLILPPKTAAA